MNEQVLIEHARQMNDVIAALIEMEAMKAANSVREVKGLSPVYGEEQFRDLMSVYEFGYNENVEKTRRFY